MRVSTRQRVDLCTDVGAQVAALGRAVAPNGVLGDSPSVDFEQYERHTVWDEPGGLAHRSGAGDLDVIIYTARKWARLALAGNPTVLLVLFVPDDEVVFRDEAGAELVDNAHRFVSRLAAQRFLGYLESQRGGIVGGVGAHTNRPELVAVHGYDTSTRCTRCGSATRGSSCSRPGASRCRARAGPNLPAGRTARGGTARRRPRGGVGGRSRAPAPR